MWFIDIPYVTFERQDLSRRHHSWYTFSSRCLGSRLHPTSKKGLEYKKVRIVIVIGSLLRSVITIPDDNKNHHLLYPFSFSTNLKSIWSTNVEKIPNKV